MENSCNYKKAVTSHKDINLTRKFRLYTLRDWPRPPISIIRTTTLGLDWYPETRFWLLTRFKGQWNIQYQRDKSIQRSYIYLMRRTSVTMQSPSIEKKVKTKISEIDHGKLLMVNFCMVFTIKNNEYHVSKQNAGVMYYIFLLLVVFRF